jgi:SPP1 gp7 family putative phage head morphogenesis protein
MPDLIPEPIEAKKYLSRKAIVETEKWDELKWGEHAHAFTVAHSRDAAVLNDIFGLLNTAMAEGKNFNSFKGEMKSLMVKKGWYGRDDKGPNDKGYINWRIGLMYHINMKTAYEAGRYRQQVRGSALRPIWEYVSKMVGKNRREDHMALNGKAFRWDDPFWDENRPPNGWGCECTVVTLSEAGAEREGVEILKSDASGNPPAMVDRNGNAVDWKNFAPAEWKYNPGKETLAPNFDKYEYLEQAGILETVRERYREDMENTKISFGELLVLKDEMAIRQPKIEEEFPENNPILYLIGNLDAETQKIMGINDSKIMINGHRIYHGFFEKKEKQAVPEKYYQDLYDTMQNPSEIYERKDVKEALKQYGREFHFSKKVEDWPGKILNIILRKPDNLAMQIITIGFMGDDHGQESVFRKIR